MGNRHEHDGGSKAKSRTKWVFIGFALIAAYFLVTEHQAHVIQYLPFLLLLGCPLMHLFHRHGGHGSHGRDSEDEKNADEKKPGGKRHAGGCH